MIVRLQPWPFTFHGHNTRYFELVDIVLDGIRIYLYGIVTVISFKQCLGVGRVR